MKRILSFFCVAMALPALAQTEGSAFTQTGHAASLTFATDYQSLGINPANLGWDRLFPEKKVTFGLLEGGYSLHTTAFDRAGLKDDFIPSLTGQSTDFTYAEKVAAAKRFTGADLQCDIDATLFGIAVSIDSAGTFAFRVRGHASWYSNFNGVTSEMMFQGFHAPYFDSLAVDLNDDGIADQIIANDANVTQTQRDNTITGFTRDGSKASTITKDSEYSFLMFRSYELGWGTRLGGNANVSWFAGVGVKYVQGFGMIQIRNDGEFIAQSSLSPGFNIDYGDDANKNPSYRSGDKFEPVGKGFGADIGISAVIKDKWKVSLAYTDIGSITWDGNVWVAADSTVNALDENGFDSYNFFAEADNFTSENGIYEWAGVSEVKTKLPGAVRTGVGMKASEKLEVGLDAVIPMTDDPGALRGPAFNVGGAYKPAPWVSINIGVGSGGNYPTRLPFGVVFTTETGTWEFGFAQRNLLSMFGGSDPTIGMTLGFLRFRV